jgi:hypothetical protein
MWIDAMQICTWFMSFWIQGCKGEREGGAILCTFQSFSKLSFYLNTIRDMMEGSSRAVLCACKSFSKLSFYLNTIVDMMELLKMADCVSFSPVWCWFLQVKKERNFGRSLLLQIQNCSDGVTDWTR